MKKILKIVGVILAIIIAYIAIAMLFFDSKYHHEQSIVINAPQDKVWQHVNAMKSINTWNPWMKFDKNLVGTYKGESGKVGDYYHWVGNDKVGEGSQEIVEIIPLQKVATKINFVKPMESNSVANITLAPEGNGTKVTWDMNFELTPMMKPMKPFFDGNMKKSYQEGLEHLKKLSEQ